MVLAKCHAKERHYAFGLCLPCYKLDYARKHALTPLQRRVKVYGLTEKQYRQLIKKQKGVCPICKHPPHGRGFVIDHCHKTGKVRGLLCNRCNIRLWSIENEEFYKAARKYLKGK